MTSVIGHVFSLDFLPQFQSWEKDPKDLFFAGTRKSEANPKAHVKRHLQDCAKGCSHVVLWLDCDREGENICFEVLECCQDYLVGAKQVWRAKFSAITAPELKAAMNKLGQPNQNEALAVDARQELDLKVGVAFTRFQTRYFQGKYGDLDATVISYGPCQTPTLNFAVEQHQRMVGFEPEPFWVVAPECSRAGGSRLAVEWERGRVFSQEIARFFQLEVQAAGCLTVASYKEDEGRKSRPHGLTTVDMLKAASSSLGMGPHHVMMIAERLYTQGYVSYPRTESSKYPDGFDFDALLHAQLRHPLWGAYVQELLQNGFRRPQGGIDVGDHPPITPVAMATESSLGGGDEWRLYDFISRHFLASVSPDCVYKRMRAALTAAGEPFTASGVALRKPGFTAIMPWAAPTAQPLPVLTVGEQLPLKAVAVREGKTSPPEHLTESELIGLMEQHGIGTDASIAVHVNNVCERNYVRVEAGRRVVPTQLGITLISGYQRIDPELCRPQVRAHVEKQIALVAEGKADKAAVVEHTLQQFLQKYLFFVQSVSRMDSLFEASFSPLTASGKPMSLCGNCNRYMKYISARPCRLYCPTCEELFALPQGGDIKLYSGATCPLDKFELLLFSMGGKDGKKQLLCPFCCNHPPFEDLAKQQAQGGAHH